MAFCRCGPTRSGIRNRFVLPRREYGIPRFLRSNANYVPVPWTVTDRKGNLMRKEFPVISKSVIYGEEHCTVYYGGWDAAAKRCVPSVHQGAVGRMCVLLHQNGMPETLGHVRQYAENGMLSSAETDAGRFVFADSDVSAVRNDAFHISGVVDTAGHLAELWIGTFDPESEAVCSDTNSFVGRRVVAHFAGKTAADYATSKVVQYAEDMTGYRFITASGHVYDFMNHDFYAARYMA